jgi:hypothetical protein
MKTGVPELLMSFGSLIVALLWKAIHKAAYV